MRSGNFSHVNYKHMTMISKIIKHEIFHTLKKKSFSPNQTVSSPSKDTINPNILFYCIFLVTVKN
jgi:hypothetical protein